MFEDLTIQDLSQILKQELNEIESLRTKIKTNMTRISKEMQRYSISTRGIKMPELVFNEGTSEQKSKIIAQIKKAQRYKQELQNILTTIESTKGIDMLKAVVNKNESIFVDCKTIEILRNMGYSDEDINLLMERLSPDENYEYLDNFAANILEEIKKEQEGTDDDEAPPEPENPYFLG